MNRYRSHYVQSAFVTVTLLFALVGCGYKGVAQRTGGQESPSESSNTVAQNGGPVVGTLEVHAFDLGFKPTTLDVEKAGRYTIKLVNDGVIPHDITFPDTTKI